MKKATMLTLAPIAAATALAGCASTGSYGYDDGGYGYYDNSYHDRYGRYDWNNPDPRYGGYYADNYYRNDRRYRERRMSDGDRIYRGRDGKYYCRRSDGTTGLIVGGIAGGVLGNVIAPGDFEDVGHGDRCHRRRGRGQCDRPRQQEGRRALPLSVSAGPACAGPAHRLNSRACVRA